MTDTVTTPTITFTPGMTIDAMRAAGVGPLLGTVRTQWLQWCRETGQPGSWPNAVIDDTYMRGEAQHAWPLDFVAFSQWALEHPELFAEDVTTTGVPSGDTKTISIGPDHPGWDAFWERVAEYAEEDGYQEQYNHLARAFGANEIDDDSEIEVDITVRIESFYVTVRQTMTRSTYDSGEYDISQTEIDDEIRDHVSHNDVDYEVSETDIVS